MVRASKPEFYRDGPRAEVGEEARDEEGVDGFVVVDTVTGGGVGGRGREECVEVADAGAEGDARAIHVVGGVGLPGGGGEGFGRGGEGILGEEGGFMDLLSGQVSEGG